MSTIRVKPTKPAMPGVEFDQDGDENLERTPTSRSMRQWVSSPEVAQPASGCRGGPPSMAVMRDGDVRSALRETLEMEHAAEIDETMFVDELDLCGRVRVDVAVVNGALSGFELKSASDSLRRLPTQVDLYSQVLDYATLVVAPNHEDRALTLIPDWWGHTTAHWVDDRVQLEVVVKPQRNPEPVPASIAMLLWRDEALDELSERELDRGLRSRPRRELCEALAAELELEDLRECVRTRLKAREGWRAGR